jgi:hypothetical protein
MGPVNLVSKREGPVKHSPGIPRRVWLAGALLGVAARVLVSPRAGAAWQAKEDSDQQEIDRVQHEARKAGLGVFGLGRTQHFVGLGDAPAGFRADEIGICEQLGSVYLDYFRKHGFNVGYPKRRMVVVTLRDDRSYRKFIGADPGDEVGGHYDLDTNRLVVFDFGSRQPGLLVNANRASLFTLVHETAHLLSFNTGLLSRQTDVPACVSEGLATFIEVWRPRGRLPLGTTNRYRLKALMDAGEDKERWIPIAALLKDDKPFDDPKTQQLAYAESWLFAHYLLKTPDQLPKFQAYLAGLAGGGKGAPRIGLAEAKLGSLGNLDRELKRHARRELR